MNSTSFVVSLQVEKNSTPPVFESWFIPLDILMIIPMALAVTLTMILLIVISIDKTCHTVPLMFVANRLLTAFVLGSTLLNSSIFTFANDFQQIQYQDSLCVLRGYIFYAAGAAQNHSNAVEAFYRYVIVVYPTRFILRSFRFQALIICLSWIISFIYPFVFLFTGEITYNVDNQICQLPLRLSFSILYKSFCAYGSPILLIVFNYVKLFRYVKKISKRVTPANTLLRAKRELKMVERIVIRITVMLVTFFPLTLFTLMSFFNGEPRYHFRIAHIPMHTAMLPLVILVFRLTEPLKISVMRRIKHRSNAVVARVF